MKRPKGEPTLLLQTPNTVCAPTSNAAASVQSPESMSQ